MRVTSASLSRTGPSEPLRPPNSRGMESRIGYKRVLSARSNPASMGRSSTRPPRFATWPAVISRFTRATSWSLAVPRGCGPWDKPASAAFVCRSSRLDPGRVHVPYGRFSSGTPAICIFRGVDCPSAVLLAGWNPPHMRPIEWHTMMPDFFRVHKPPYKGIRVRCGTHSDQGFSFNPEPTAHSAQRRRR